MSHESALVSHTAVLSSETLLLEGHKASVNSVKWNTTGGLLATGSSDCTVLLWRIDGDSGENIATLRGHHKAVVELAWNDDYLVSASADRVAAVWDWETGLRTRALRGHTGIVNSCDVMKGKVLTGSDDGSANIWDPRESAKPILSVSTPFPITTVKYVGNDDVNFATSGIDPHVLIWDARNTDVPIETLQGHSQTVTGISVSNDGCYILSNSMDNTAAMWDARPYVEGPTRFIRTFSGFVHNFEQNLLRTSWSPKGDMVAVGSADNFVYIFDSDTSKYILIVYHVAHILVGSCTSFLGTLAPLMRLRSILLRVLLLLAVTTKLSILVDSGKVF